MRNILLISLLMEHQTPVEEPGINSIGSFLISNGFNVKIVALKDEPLEQEIIDFNPFLVGISVYNETVNIAESISNQIKSVIPECNICLGGYAPTYYPQEISDQIKSIDFIIKGEGEMAFLQLAEHLSQKKNISLNDVGNLIYKNNNELTYNKKNDLIENLDLLPFSDRSLIKKYNSTDIWVLTSRGCSRNCGFCCNHDFWKREPCNWRGHSIEYVIDELKTIIDTHKIRQFEFIDNSFEEPYPYLERAGKITQKIINEGVKIAFGINMRTETFDRLGINVFDTFIDAGLSYVYLGIESFNKDDLIFYQKSSTVEKHINAIKFLVERNIAFDVGFINFNPYTTFESLQNNLHYLYKYGFSLPHYILTFLKLFRNTGNYDTVKNDNMLLMDNPLNVYCYKYKDNNINELAKMLLSIRDDLENTDTFKMCNLIIHFSKKSAMLKRILHQFGIYDESMSGAFNTVTEIFNSVRMEKNNYFYDYFSKLFLNYKNYSINELFNSLNNTADLQFYNTLQKAKFVFYKKIKKHLLKFDLDFLI